MSFLKPREIEALARAWQWVKGRPRVVASTASATLLTAIGTFCLAGVALFQYAITGEQLREARAEQRPWVYAELSEKHIEANYESSNRFSFSIGFEFSNVGHLPAIGVDVGIESTLAISSDSQVQKKFVDRACELANPYRGFNVFPGQRIDRTNYYDVEFNKSELESFNRYDPLDQPGSSIMASIFVCVSYLDPTGQRHHTPYKFNYIATPEKKIQLEKTYILPFSGLLSSSPPLNFPPD